MITMLNTARAAIAAFMIASAAACSSGGGMGGLGGILGSVLGGGQQQQNQVSGRIQGVDTRRQEISLQQSNGQTVRLGFDNRTRVVYQNQNYPVTALEYGDEVTARVASGGNSGYYTDYVQVNRSVSNSSGGVSGNVQAIEGTVRQVDRTNGWFSVDTRNYGRVTVSMPYNARQNDINRFQSLRSGDFVRLHGTFLNNSRAELTQFY